MSNEPISMWPYHKDEYYKPYVAVRDHYPELLRENEELARAVAQAETADRAILQIMKELYDEDLLSD